MQELGVIVGSEARRPVPYANSGYDSWPAEKTQPHTLTLSPSHPFTLTLVYLEHSEQVLALLDHATEKLVVVTLYTHEFSTSASMSD